MKPSRPSSLPPRPRASALLTVIMFTAVMSLMAGSILVWTVQERKLNARMVYWLEARNAAESLCEYGAAQVNTVVSNLTLPPSVEKTFFDPAQAVGSNYNPVQLPFVPGTTNSFFNPNSANGLTNESHIDTNAFETSAGALVDKYGLEVIAGRQVPIPSSGALYVIDPSIPENVNDPYVGLRVVRFDYNIIAKASAVPKDGNPPVTAYVKQTVSLRGAPLFDWAVFYGTSDLEIYPGADMTITGPVHTNNDMYLNAAGGATLTFTGSVTATGHIFHAQENSTDGQVAMTNDNIYFAGPAGEVSMYDGTIWHDSTNGTDVGVYGPDTSGNPLYTKANNSTNKTNFTNYAESTWPGNVLTADMGVLPFNPKGFNNALAAGSDPNGNLYKADTPYVDNGTQIPVTGATTTIDHHISATDGATTAAGNVSFFNDPPDSDFPTMATTSAYYVARKGLEDVKYANLANLYILVNVNTGVTPYTATVTYYGPYNFNKIGGAATTYNGAPGPNGGVLLGQNNYTATAASAGPLASAGLTGVEPYGLVSFIPYTVDGSGHVLTGLYDRRQSTPVDLVQINVNALNRALMDANLDPTTNTNNANNIYGGPNHAYPGETGATTYLDAIINNQDPTPNAVTNHTHTLANATIWGSGSTSFTGTNIILNDNTAGYRDGAATLGGWNGTIYVDVEANPVLDPNVAHTHEIGVGIGNGQTTLATGGASISNNSGPDQDTATINLVPNHLNADGTPTADSPLGSVPDAIVGRQTGLNSGAGLTIATNAPVFVVGNFNADGAHTTATAATDPDDGLVCPTSESDECPVAIIGDAVTFLSYKYFNSSTPASGAKFTDATSNAAWFPHFANDGTAPPANGTTSNAYNSKNVNGPATTGDTEVAMAMVSGLVLTDAAAASGGVHNLPRYLESWSGHAHVIRGSLVNLYVSKIAIADYTTAGYYGPPVRTWGFAKLFSKCGILPPSTPLTYANRRIYFNDLSAAQYSALRSDTTWGWPSDTFQPLP
jgi:hypothetical protein